MNTFGENGENQKLPYDAAEEIEIELSWFAITDRGLRRETNEDSYVAIAPVFAVADGMGGHAAGDIASQTVAKNVAETAERGRVGEEALNAALMTSVENITEIVGEQDLGAGTTITGVMFSDEEAPTWKIFNIGDSRVYQYFKGSLTQITVDHSIVQHLVDTGAITAEEADTHPHANVITRAVGFNEDPIPDYTSLALIPGQRILICSDGLIKELTDVGLQHFLSMGMSAKETAEELLAQALANSGRDNITLIIIDVHSVAGESDYEDLTDPAQEIASLNDTEEVPLLDNDQEKFVE